MTRAINNRLKTPEIGESHAIKFNSYNYLCSIYHAISCKLVLHFYFLSNTHWLTNWTWIVQTIIHHPNHPHSFIQIHSRAYEICIIVIVNLNRTNKSLTYTTFLHYFPLFKKKAILCIMDAWEEMTNLKFSFEEWNWLCSIMHWFRVMNSFFRWIWLLNKNEEICNLIDVI